MKRDADDSDTNFGWWVDKPDREERPTTFHAPLNWASRPPESSGFSWSTALLIVLLMTAFVWSLKSLAGW